MKRFLIGFAAALVIAALGLCLAHPDGRQLVRDTWNAVPLALEADN